MFWSVRYALSTVVAKSKGDPFLIFTDSLINNLFTSLKYLSPKHTYFTPPTNCISANYKCCCFLNNTIKYEFSGSFSPPIYTDYKKAIHQYMIKCSLGENKRTWPTELIDHDSCMSWLSSLVFFVGFLRVGMGQLLIPLPTYKDSFHPSGLCYPFLIWWYVRGLIA